MEPAFTIGSGAETYEWTDDELCAIAEMNTLYGVAGAKIGHFLVSRATIGEREANEIERFVRNVQAKLDELLVVYDHGHGMGTVCFQHKKWYELVRDSGVHYQKPTPKRDLVIYKKGRSVKNAAMPDTLRDVPPLISALDKLEAALILAREGATLTSSPRQTYEYF